ncbi:MULTISPECIES: hypothetical protein [unclassified Rhodococcus (in: high G+C Gram-positive bacteria)]|nr:MULTISPECIES: hypothetical protein [unclassified Rhodococcus (in: high G+C Gram-positive bacteria)]
MAEQKRRIQRGTRPLFNDSMTGKSDFVLVIAFAALAATTWWLLF